MLGDDRFRKVAARVLVDDKNVEGTYASDSVAAVAQSAIAALVLFLVLIMMLLIGFGQHAMAGRPLVPNLVRHSQPHSRSHRRDGRRSCI